MRIRQVRPFYGLREVADMLAPHNGPSYATLWRAARRGDVASIRAGSTWLIPAGEVERLLRQRKDDKAAA